MSNQIRAIEDLSTSWFGAPLGGHQAFGEIRCCLRLSGSPCAVLQLNPWAGRFIVREEYILQIAVQASFRTYSCAEFCTVQAREQQSPCRDSAPYLLS